MHPAAQLARNWSLRVGPYLFSMTVDPAMDVTVIALNSGVKFAIGNPAGAACWPTLPGIGSSFYSQL
jgi:hypothetical protein